MEGVKAKNATSARAETELWAPSLRTVPDTKQCSVSVWWCGWCSLEGNLLWTGKGNEPGKGKDNQCWGYREKGMALMLGDEQECWYQHLLLINKGILWSFGWNIHLLNWDHWTRLQIWTNKGQRGVLAVLWPSRCPFTFSWPFTYTGYLASELSYFLLWEGQRVCFHVILFFFLMWTIFKVILNLLQYCLCLMFWFFLAMRHVGS